MTLRNMPLRALSGMLSWLLWATLYPGSAQALSVPGLIGTWGVTERTEFAIDGFGHSKVKGDGNCVITDRDETSGGLSCRAFDPSQGQNYSGGLNTLQRLKKLGWGLDSAGLEQVKSNLRNWLIAKNLRRGNILEPENVDFEFDSLKYAPIKLTQDEAKPVAANATLKGRAVQIVNGKYIVKRYTYSIKIKFIARAP